MIEQSMEHYTLDQDYFRIVYPVKLSPESVADLEAYMSLFMQRLKRRVKTQ